MQWGTVVVTTNTGHAMGEEWWLPDTVHAVETRVVATRAL